ncbi:MAG TPA: type II toxin-antitoxin system RelE/ParE family toxin [Rhodanobacteraceae bacterium]|nr:type II toxin-antitoxin system RelE/ParE family toxin [Rhodanobacteraceae bacterium]
MARFELRIKRSVAKDLSRLPKADNRRIVARIRALAEDPRPQGCEKLAGRESYRIRQGNYRVVYTIDDDRVIVEVVRVGHRGDVYRQ